MTVETTYQKLKEKMSLKRSVFSDDHAVRLHRALSWYEASMKVEVLDLKLVNLWISFHACHFVPEDGSRLSDQYHFKVFINKVVELDNDNQLYHCLWHTYSGSVKSLIKNPYVFAPFWHSQRLGNSDWELKFNESSVNALNALSRGHTADLLIIVLDRLYILQHQILRGGATYKSEVNRSQIIDGVNILASIMPVLLDIMLENHCNEWGELSYPVISK